jgi:hypothetical protein
MEGSTMTKIILAVGIIASLVGGLAVAFEDAVEPVSMEKSVSRPRVETVEAPIAWVEKGDSSRMVLPEVKIYGKRPAAKVQKATEKVWTCAGMRKLETKTATGLQIKGYEGRVRVCEWM